ncbi:formate dehydrogenase accessory sulfurtransferase FdhD [Szabonella alba]|uniref:Sulfur carrier protein FdhD n=1 Tax=Szabonella alba TaxID=2804194 RepID=A0A8K0VEQ5_9RHOB|nr:formate dehydrogenase accessory sulfurtransferase FdhD [Szabonella alba]MBL4917952.1 formate dehydrogenase accessory sulfurtransferase FdhD [Szabonella alba]
MQRPPLYTSVPGRAVRPEGGGAIHRALPAEVAVALVFDGSTQAVMMATPGDIRDFVTGFALSEGIIASPDEIESFEEVAQPGGIEARVWLRGDRGADLTARRRAMTGPVGCGLCGIDSLAEANRPLPVLPETGLRLSASDILRAGADLRQHQPLHARTRATHAAAFLRPNEGIVLLREDVGRHNALDKLLGALALAGTDPGTGAIYMTSRLSMELVQKAAIAGCPVLIAVSAPTAHALQLAEATGMTLAAFAREDGFDLYSRPDRILTEVSDVA